MRKRWALLAAVAFLAGVGNLAGCGKTYVETDVTVSAVPPETSTAEVTTAPALETTEETHEESRPEPDQRLEEDGKIQSYLTGEMVDVAKANRRPVAVMMSNDKQALPHYGINRAGVVYEAPVEGGMNRYMAIMEDYDDLERIGSVRSCRTYYTYFAKEFDAIYAHYGQSTFAKPYLKNVDNINGLEGIGGSAYYRSSERKSPHNAYTSFQGLQEAMGKLGYSQEYDQDYKGHYRFARAGDQVVLDNALEAWKVYPGYGMNQPYFEYNEEDGLYYRYQYGGPHNGDEGQIAVRNLIFQYCAAGRYATTEYLDIDVHEPQYGYYITGGRAIALSWEKDGQFGVTHYYNTENEEITLNRGKTWVCIIPTRDFSKTEIHGKSE